MTNYIEYYISKQTTETAIGFQKWDICNFQENDLIDQTTE